MQAAEIWRLPISWITAHGPISGKCAAIQAAPRELPITRVSRGIRNHASGGQCHWAQFRIWSIGKKTVYQLWSILPADSAKSWSPRSEIGHGDPLHQSVIWSSTPPFHHLREDALSVDAVLIAP